MTLPSCASTTASSTSGMSVTHTGQPGPMITFRALGRTARSPNLAIDCSWLPHTCITETGARPISAHTLSSARDNARALAGSRNLSCSAPGSVRVSGTDASPPRSRPRRRDLAAHVRRHHVRLGFLEQLLVEREGFLDLARGDLADGEPHVIEDVVSRLNGLVDDVQPGLPADAEEIDGRRYPVNFDHLSGDAETHTETSVNARE